MFTYKYNARGSEHEHLLDKSNDFLLPSRVWSKSVRRFQEEEQKELGCGNSQVEPQFIRIGQKT